MVPCNSRYKDKKAAMHRVFMYVYSYTRAIRSKEPIHDARVRHHRPQQTPACPSLAAAPARCTSGSCSSNKLRQQLFIAVAGAIAARASSCFRLLSKHNLLMSRISSQNSIIVLGFVYIYNTRYNIYIYIYIYNI